MKKEKTESIHDKHEFLTNQAYQSIDMFPARYVFVLTTKCNLRCSFCFQGKEPKNDTMETKDWIYLAKQLPDYARVTITGGEPFFFKGFMDVFKYTASRFDCNIITNGTLLNKDQIEAILQYPKFKVLSISVDNVGNTIRDISPSKWEKTEKMIRYFVKRRNELHTECVLDIKTTVLDENANDLLKIHKYCTEKLKCDTHGFQFLKGSIFQHADNACNYEDIMAKLKAPVYKKFKSIVDQLEQIRSYNLKNGKKAFMHPKFASLNTEKPLSDIGIINQSFHNKNNFGFCKYPWSSVHINTDGNLFPCLSVPLGNVKKEPLQNIIAGDDFKRFKNLIRSEGSVPACNRCGWLKLR